MFFACRRAWRKPDPVPCFRWDRARRLLGPPERPYPEANTILIIHSVIYSTKVLKQYKHNIISIPTMFNALFSDAFEIYPHTKVSQGNLKSMENMKMMETH